jgi:hypothetical protein
MLNYSMIGENFNWLSLPQFCAVSLTLTIRHLRLNIPPLGLALQLLPALSGSAERADKFREGERHEKSHEESDETGQGPPETQEDRSAKATNGDPRPVLDYHAARLGEPETLLELRGELPPQRM